MASTPNDSSDGDLRSKEWSAYSDYQFVSQSVSESIANAIEAYALLDQAAREGCKTAPGEVARMRADILSAAMMLRVELEAVSGNEQLDEIEQRWKDGEDPGHISKFRTADLTSSQPDWLYQFVSDIRKAGWELGYLQAGREETDWSEDPYDGEVIQMLEGMEG